jgi:hypothetical protein
MPLPWLMYSAPGIDALVRKVTRRPARPGGAFAIVQARTVYPAVLHLTGDPFCRATTRQRGSQLKGWHLTRR